MGNIESSKEKSEPLFAIGPNRGQEIVAIATKPENGDNDGETDSQQTVEQTNLAEEKQA